MSAIAYVANSFPEPSEAYVTDEILELRRHGCRVLPCSFRTPKRSDLPASFGHGTVYAFPFSIAACLSASWMCIRRFPAIAALVRRALQGPESFSRRVRTLIHTWLGAYLAVLLKKERITHIHVHHGYFASWCAMIAARLLGIEFSMTLHGSDLLVRGDYLDCKLANCRFCFTVSEFNRNYIVDGYPSACSKVVVHRMGINVDRWCADKGHPSPVFNILSVGRLHPVKNHAFLVLACHSLKTAGVTFFCRIAGEGSEREQLQRLIRELGLDEQVQLLGFVPRTQLPELYRQADVVALTSRSEGIPVALMEAMAIERVVLAPAITGIPELITSGETGFLYQPGSMDDFLAKLTTIRMVGPSLTKLRQAARRHIESHFDSRQNLVWFADDFLERIAHGTQPRASHRQADEDSLLQQVQLRV